MNEQLLQARPAPINAEEFFNRSRARLGFDVPPGLIDPNIIPRTGDSGNDRMPVAGSGVPRTVTSVRNEWP